MKPALFHSSALAIAVTLALGLTSTANAVTTQSYSTTNAFTVSNKAEATYKVAGNDTVQTAQSNEVVVNVSEVGSFSLIATDNDGDNKDNTNSNGTINPQAGSKVSFTHTLTNDGNVTDSYKINLANDATSGFNYDIAASNIRYQKYVKGDQPIGKEETITNNGSISLNPGEYAKIIIDAVSSSQTPFKTKGVLSVQATSAYLQLKNTSGSATNTDTAETISPIYAITKSAVTNLGTNRFDLNNADSYVDYTIVIKNEGNVDGKSVTIEDKLPEGLMAIRPNEANYVAPKTVASNGSAAVTPIISANGELISVTGQNIKKDETITITFRAKKSAIASNNSNFVNYAVVKEDTNGDGSFDLVDSSGDKSDTRVTENNYENSAFPNIGKDDNSKAEIVATSQTRKLTVSSGVNKEVALQSQTVYNYTITNAGTDLKEGFNKGDVAISVKATDDNPKIAIERVFVDANNNGILDAGETILTANANGEYDLYDAIPGGLGASQSINIGVEVRANGSGSKLNTNSDIGTTETMTITVTPKKTILGTPAPSAVSTTSITTMQGIDLTKYQALADCGSDPSSIMPTDWKTAPIGDAKAGSCVFYKLEAKNTFKTTEITNVALNDTLDRKLTYQKDFKSTTDANSPIAINSSSDTVIKGTFNKLIGGETGKIFFSGKISQSGTN